MKSFRALIFCFAAGLLVSSVYGLEWELDPVSSLQFGNLPSPPAIFQQELLGSLKVPLDTKGGGLAVKGHVLAGTPATFFGDFDVFALSLAFQRPGSSFQVLKGTLGRFAMTEPTGLILNHPGDGLKFELASGDFTLALAEAYTGLVNRASSGISLTLEDQAHASDWFASPRLIGSLEAGTLLWGHHLTLGVLVQHDLSPVSDLIAVNTNVYSSTKGGTLDTQYFTLKVSGPAADKLFYEVFGTLGTGSTLSWVTDSSSSTGFSYQYRPITAFLLGATASYFRPDWLEAAFKARFIGASGDPKATSVVEGNVGPQSTLFLPLTATTLGVAFNPALSNLAYYELGGSLKPLPPLDLVTGVKIMEFQRAASTGVVNAPGVLSSGPAWMGTEIDLNASWPVTSDSLLTVTVGDFIPTAGTYPTGSVGDGNQFAASLNASLSL